MSPSSDEIVTFHASDLTLLPPQTTLALHLRLGLLSLLSARQLRASLQVQACLSAAEMRVLLCLLGAFPHYCSDEVLYASFSQKEREVACKELQQARTSGTFERDIQPVRGAISRIRHKLLPFRIEIVSIASTGYMLKRQEKGADQCAHLSKLL